MKQHAVALITHSSRYIIVFFFCVFFSLCVLICFCSSQKQQSIPNLSSSQATLGVAAVGMDAFFWQMGATVFLPAMVVNRVCWAVSKILRVNATVGGGGGGRGLRSWIPILCGLSVIPVLPHVIDPLMDTALDLTLRKFTHSWIPGTAPTTTPDDNERR